MVANGAKVYIIGRRKNVLDSAVKNFGADGNIVAIEGDVTSKASLESAVNEIASKEQHVDLLINNSGISGPQYNMSGKTVEQIKEDLFKNANFSEWDDVFRSNVSSIYFTSLAFLPLLRAGTMAEKRFSASIINVSSVVGLSVESTKNHSYPASKAAAAHMTKLLAKSFVMTCCPALYLILGRLQSPREWHRSWSIP